MHFLSNCILKPDYAIVCSRNNNIISYKNPMELIVSNYISSDQIYNWQPDVSGLHSKLHFQVNL